MATAEIKAADDELDDHTKPPFLRRVRIRGYKSIAFCDVTLEPLTILVGRNGSGKSNFLDALAFLSDLVTKGVPEAVLAYGGWEGVLCRVIDFPKVCIEFESEYSLHEADLVARGDAAWAATYSVDIENIGKGAPQIAHEKLRLATADGHRWTQYEVDRGVVRWSGDSYVHPLYQWGHAGRAFLSIYESEPFASFREGLEMIGAYNFAPQKMRELQRPMGGSLLRKDGSNFASVITALMERDAAVFERIQQYVRAIAPDVESVEPIRYGEFETVRFRMRSCAQAPQMRFDAANMSDGTLRALASLVAVFQMPARAEYGGVIGIEEPETALHPAAMRVLVDALRDATQHTQVLITTHSPDLLDDRHIDPRQVLVVRNRKGQTQIAPVGPAGKEIVQKELYSLADLHRMDHLDPDEEDLIRQAAETNGKQEK